MAKARWAIAIHGGAGVIERDRLRPEQEAAYRQALAHVVETGRDVLEAGGSAVDAVEAAIRALEDDPLFNSGRGAVFTATGRNEHDASIMDGSTLGAGSVAGMTRVKHPITLARAIMERSPHVMLVGRGAEAYAETLGVELVEPGYFFTERRWKSLLNFLKAEHLPVPHRPAGAPTAEPARAALAHDEGKHGTVGVVALDRQGNVAAGTSTGGTTGKRFGRVGDSPLIGAGTYASNAACAVSATGAGEYFIRLTVARDIAALVELKGLSLQAAADEVVQNRLVAIGGDGGVICVAPGGKIAWSFNTSGMYRGRAHEGGPIEVGIYKDEP
jgi:beta-aspartyl-peptidase (threonine type)